MLYAALPRINAMQLKGNLSTQLIDQEAGTGPLIRSDLKDSLRLDLGSFQIGRTYPNQSLVNSKSVVMSVRSISIITPFFRTGRSFAVQVCPNRL
jgi:hypothetical protein